MVHLELGLAVLCAGLALTTAQCPFLHPNPAPYVYRNSTGAYNNLRHPLRGSLKADTNTWSTIPRADAELHDPDQPNVRKLSNELFDHTEVVFDSRGLNTLHMQWGQFVNHDISLVFDLPLITPNLVKDDIVIPDDDKVFPPESTMLFRRVDGIDQNRAENHITSWLDASSIYGDTPELVERSRDPKNRHLLFLGPDGYPGIDERGLFLFGESRANQVPLLTSIHLLFFREHNWVASTLKKQFPEWDDDKIFNEARIIVEAELQDITYQEWLPALTGEKYKEQEYSEESMGELFRFFNILFRMGHSMVPDSFDRRDPVTFQPHPLGPWRLCVPEEKRANFFGARQSFLETGGIDSTLAGALFQRMEAVDMRVGDCMRNHMFRGLPIGSEAADIVSLSVARGRDLGLPSFQTFKKDLLNVDVDDFDGITSDPDLQEKLRTLYNDKVEKVDMYVGMLAEDHAPGSSVGPSVKAGVLLQLSRLQRADRFWYRRRLQAAVGDQANRSKYVCRTVNQRAEKNWCNTMCNASPRISYCNDPAWCVCEIDRIHELRRFILGPQSTLRNVIQRNTKIKSVQSNPFVANNAQFAAQHRYAEPSASYEPKGLPIGDN